MSGSISRTAAVAAGGGTKEMIYIPPEALVIDKEFDLREDLGDIPGLAQSIADDGFHDNEPVLVRVNKETKKFHVADGRRRTRAAMYAKEKLGWSGKVAAVPLDPKTSDEELIFRTMNSNNEHRKPFTAMEEGLYFLKLRDELNVSEKNIGERIHRSTTHVRDRIALVKIDSSIKPEIESYIKSGVLSVTAAMGIAKESPEVQVTKWNELRDAHNNEKANSPAAASSDNSTKKNSKSNKIKVGAVNQATKGKVSNVSVKVMRVNIDRLEAAFKETKHDRYEFAAQALRDTLNGKVIKL